MFIYRELEPILKSGLESGKVIVLFGAHQTGKTTLVRHILDDKLIKAKGVLSLNGDNPAHRTILDHGTFSLDAFVCGDI